MINIKRIWALTKIVTRAHILNPFWWTRNRRRARRCDVAARAIPEYFKKYLPAVAKVIEVPVIKDDKNEKVYTMWGWNPITPPMIQACFDSMRANFKQELQVINEKNINDFVDLPGFIMDKRNKGYIKNPHFADIVRVELLHNHGGFWLDSTAFATAPIPDFIVREDFFVYMAGNVGSPYGYIQNCFIRGRQGSYLLEAWRAMILEYWKNESCEFDYFMHQLMFKTVAKNDPRGKIYFDKMPHVDQDPTHALWWEYADKPFNKELFDKITKDAFFQKTAWKHAQAQNPTPNSFADNMIKMYK